MKKFLNCFMFLMSLCLLTACPSDDDDEGNENSPGSKVSSQFVGLWKMTGIKKSGQTRGAEASLLFYKDGKLRVLNDKNDLVKDYNWTYDEKTRILSTTAVVNACNLQWEITLVADDSFAGIGLWDAANNGSIMAERVDLSSFRDSYYADDYTKLFLMGRIWRNEANESIICNNNFLLEGSAVTKYFSRNGLKLGSLLYGANDDRIRFDKSKDQISFFFIYDRYRSTTIKIDHPFCLNDSQLQLTIDGNNDFMENGKYTVAN